MLPKKLASPLARVVRRVTILSGMTGWLAQNASVATKRIQRMALATKRPTMIGEDHGSSSFVLRENPRSTVDTAPTRVADPRKSILAHSHVSFEKRESSFAYDQATYFFNLDCSGSFWISVDSLTLTLK
jgi:hypothetical protein